MVLVSAALPPEHTTQSEHMSYAVLCGAYVLRSCGHKSTVDDRLAYIQRKQLCSNCFKSSHQLRDCTSAPTVSLVKIDVYVKSAYNFRRQCRALALPSTLHLHLSPKSPLRYLSYVRLNEFLFQSEPINIYACRVKTPKYPRAFAYHSFLGLQLFSAIKPPRPNKDKV